MLHLYFELAQIEIIEPNINTILEDVVGTAKKGAGMSQPSQVVVTR